MGAAWEGEGGGYVGEGRLDILGDGRVGGYEGEGKVESFGAWYVEAG